MAKQELCTGTFTVAKWVVSADPTQGTHTTITAALSAASSGDTIFLRDGTYTENITLKAGVSLCAFTADSVTPNVTIIGKCSFSAAGRTSLSGIRLQTNGDFLLEVTGASASNVYFKDCYLNCSNNTGISCSSASATIGISDSVYALTGAVALFSLSAGVLFTRQLYNEASSTTASTASAGTIDIYNSIIGEPLTTSGTASIFIKNSNVGTGSGVIALTVGGSGGGLVQGSVFTSLTVEAITVGTGSNLILEDCIVSTDATNAITGAGTINYGWIDFQNSKLISTSTQTQSNAGTFTPVLNFGGGTTGITYSQQVGKYQRIGNLLFYNIEIILSSKGSSTGSATITGMPIAGVGNTEQSFVTVGVTLDAGNIYPYYQSGGTTLTLYENGLTGGQTVLTDTNFANTSQIWINGFYPI